MENCSPSSLNHDLYSKKRMYVISELLCPCPSVVCMFCCNKAGVNTAYSQLYFCCFSIWQHSFFAGLVLTWSMENLVITSKLVSLNQPWSKPRASSLQQKLQLLFSELMTLSNCTLKLKKREEGAMRMQFSLEHLKNNLGFIYVCFTYTSHSYN